MLTPRNLPRSPTVVSGRQIVSDFKKNNVVATASYERICTTLESFERLETAALAQILDQLLDLADILDESCTRLVKALTRLPWIAISEAQDVAFQNLLTELAIRHIVHTETVLGAAIDHLIPAVEKPEPGNTEMKLLLSAEKQDELFKKSFLLISQILKCIPMAGRLLIRDNGSSLIRDRFPHHSRCSLHFIGYVKSLLQLCEVVPYLREQIFSLLIDRLAAIDAREAGSKKSSDKSGTLFLIDEGIAEMSDGETEPFSRNPEAASEKLDISLSYCLGYLNVLHGVETSTDMSWLRVYDQHPEDPDSVFHFTKRTFEHYVLMASGLQLVPFLWFHLASLHEKHVDGMLSWLWSMVQRPGQSPNDWRKSQAAATYIAAFIARAKYVDTSATMRWLRQLAEWLTSYVNQVGLSSAKMAPGGARHGTFYAVAQAFFIAFCFRYTDIVNAGEMDEIRRWGLGHIIHSPLEPLRYASRHVALCFAVITRSLQLVYCNHVIPLASDDVRRPFEVFFPFERCQYERILETISPLMRSFSPLAEDVPKLAKELQMAMPKAAVEENSMDFLDEDDDFRIATESILMPSSRSSVFTVYPSSPGLRPFDFELR